MKSLKKTKADAKAQSESAETMLSALAKSLWL
jgi:hypothetical protein